MNFNEPIWHIEIFSVFPRFSVWLLRFILLLRNLKFFFLIMFPSTWFLSHANALKLHGTRRFHAQKVQMRFFFRPFILQFLHQKHLPEILNFQGQSPLFSSWIIAKNAKLRSAFCVEQQPGELLKIWLFAGWWSGKNRSRFFRLSRFLRGGFWVHLINPAVLFLRLRCLKLWLFRHCRFICNGNRTSAAYPGETQNRCTCMNLRSTCRRKVFRTWAGLQCRFFRILRNESSLLSLLFSRWVRLVHIFRSSSNKSVLAQYHLSSRRNTAHSWSSVFFGWNSHRCIFLRLRSWRSAKSKDIQF